MSDLPNLPMPALRSFCAKWKVQELSLFGSALRDDFGPQSDVDFLVTFAPEAQWSLLDHIRMEEELSLLLDRHIDLVSRAALERSANFVRRREILSSAKVVYAA